MSNGARVTRRTGRRSACATVIVIAASTSALLACGETSTAPSAPTAFEESVVVRWNSAALDAVRHSKLGPPMVARALAVANTAMYDAWSVYDAQATATRPGPARRPASERTTANKARAVSFAAYDVLVDLFPSEQASFVGLMQQLGYDATDRSTDPATPTGIGNAAGAAVLAFRHTDGANQLGDLAPGSYADYTGYVAVNSPSEIVDPNRWQPLLATDAQGITSVQKFVGAQWGLVTPFALTSGTQFRPASVPNLYPSEGYTRQVDEIIEYSANLTDAQKTIVEYWADGPATELPPGHWVLFAKWVARRDSNTVDDDAKLFFALTNAMLDVSIAVWDCKRTFDYVRPITAVRFLMKDRDIRAWAGPYRGIQTIRGEQWQAYQTGAQPTPAFPEFSSGHSAFSSAAAEVLRSFTGSDAFGHSVTIEAGKSAVEPGAVPASDVTLSWPTFSAAADEAGMSRRYGGIHFVEGDLQSRAMGRKVGAQAWTKASSYFDGTAVR
jgi:hypothetical protein